jgi:hypothetical protein
LKEKLDAAAADADEKLAEERATVKECEENSVKEVEDYNILVEKYNKLKTKHFKLKETLAIASHPPSHGGGSQVDGDGCGQVDVDGSGHADAAGGDDYDAEVDDQVEVEGGGHADAEGGGGGGAPSSCGGNSRDPSRPLQKLSIELDKYSIYSNT